MNKIFIVLVILFTSLNKNSVIAQTHAENEFKIFADGMQLVTIAQNQLLKSIDLLKNTPNSDNVLPDSANALTRDADIYLTIHKLTNEFASDDSDEKRKLRIMDHLSILAYLHTLIPRTIITKEDKNKIFEKLGRGRSDAANYFIECLIYNLENSTFSLTQSIESHKSVQTFIGYGKELMSMPKERFSDAQEIDDNYMEVRQLITNLSPKIERYNWSDSLEYLAQTTFEIFDALEPDLSIISKKLYQANNKIKEAINEYKRNVGREQATILLNMVFQQSYSNRFNNAVSKVQEQKTLQNITKENVGKFINDRIRLYHDSIKELEKISKDYPSTNAQHLYFIRIFEKNIKLYKEIGKQFSKINIETNEEVQNIAEEVYLQLTTHLLEMEQKDSSEEYYLKPIIDFVSMLVSDEVKIFKKIIQISVEGEKLSYNIDFKDDLHTRWTKLRNRLTPISEMQSSPNIEEELISTKVRELVSTKEELEAIYANYADSFNALLDDNRSQSSFDLFKIFKPQLTKYKKVVTKKVNVFESLINSYLPVNANKKKKRAKTKKESDTKTQPYGPETTTPEISIIDTVVKEETSPINACVTSSVLEKITEETHEEPIATQQQKRKKEKRKTQEEIQETNPTSTEILSIESIIQPILTKEEEEKATYINPFQKEKERKRKIKEKIAHQQAIENQRKEAELAEILAKQRKRKNELFIDKPYQEAIPSNIQNADNDHNQHQDVHESQNPITSSTRTNLTKQPQSPKSKFILNPNAAIFEPVQTNVKQGLNQQNLTIEQEQNRQQYWAIPPMYYPFYAPNYITGDFYQQAALQPYVIPFVGCSSPYGYPPSSQLPHLQGVQRQQSHS